MRLLINLTCGVPVMYLLVRFEEFRASRSLNHYPNHAFVIYINLLQLGLTLQRDPAQIGTPQRRQIGTPKSLFSDSNRNTTNASNRNTLRNL